MDEPVDELEHFLENVKQTSTTDPRIGSSGGPVADERAQLPHELVQDVHVHDAEDNEKGGRHGCPDDAADVAEAVEALANRCGGGGDDYGGYDDDAGGGGMLGGGWDGERGEIKRGMVT